MSEFLLEILSEEIPARMQRGAIEQLQTKLKEELEAQKLTFSDMRLFVTPRRLVAVIKGLPKEMAATASEKRGPRVGASQGAIDGFCRGAGISAAELEERDGFYFAVVKSEGGAVAPILKNMVEKILSGFHWPKSMRWGSYALQWVRPLQSIICLFDGEVIPVQFGHIKAGNWTCGHRFLSNGKHFEVQNYADYAEKLRAAHVLVDQDERRKMIERDTAAVAAKHNLAVKPDAGLLEEVTGLVEWPVVVMGGFEAQYLSLPQEVPTTVMRSHQKYFALTKADGSLAPNFITISNMAANDGGNAIQGGNERVLRARLSDGKFFYDQDLKTKLADHANGLSDMVFHAKIGSVAEKVTRIGKLAAALAPFAHADAAMVARAAELCKADLTTGMVGEFPELQGLMGRYYALAQGEKAEVADAIRDHYKPLGPNDDCPKAPVSVVIALADKLDTLVGLFAVGEKPTGSKDPFALRRAALGVIRLILENNIRLPLTAVLGAKPEELLEFFSARLQVMLREEGIGHDRIKAVFGKGEDDLVRLVARARALDGFLKTEDGGNLLAAFRRAANITRIEEEKSGAISAKANPGTQVEEQALFAVLSDVESRVQQAVKEEQYESAMSALAELRAPVDAFFEKVTVNADDAGMRANRLATLKQTYALFQSIADFSVIEG